MEIIYDQWGRVKEFIMEVPDKDVTCIRCYTLYNPSKVKKLMPDNLRIKEPACPNCKCKLYITGDN